MKKIIKNRVFIVIICGIIFTSLGVYGANNYKASEVIYNPSNGEPTNVNDALNYLYENSSNVQIGNISTKLNGNSVTKTITFDKPFSKIPTVVIGRNNHSAYYGISSITTTEFTATFSTTDNNEKNATINWNWVAYEKD